MRYFKLFTTGVMLYTAFQAVRGTFLFHTTTEYHNALTANTIGTLSFTSVACLIMLVCIWNYKAILREQKENA